MAIVTWIDTEEIKTKVLDFINNLDKERCSSCGLEEAEMPDSKGNNLCADCFEYFNGISLVEAQSIQAEGSL